jgi:phosphopantetheinyl transferase
MKIAHSTVDSRGAHAIGRELLAELYLEETGKPLPPILIQDRGKPCFAHGDWHFSITHTRHHVFCALAAHPIGIDAEELNRDVNLRLAEKILSPDEKAQFNAAPDPRRALLTFWVLKEAAAKQSGIGLNGYPNHTHFSLDDPRVTESHGCLLAIIET